VLPVQFHRESRTSVAVESAFAEHLRVLQRMLAPGFASLTVAAPVMDPGDYERERGVLGRIDEEREAIRYVALHPGSARGASFWLRHFPVVLARLAREVRRADLVHAGPSHNLWRPVESAALLLAKLSGKRTLCVVDIDLRHDARMNRRTGRWSRRTAWICRAVYDPLRSLQLRAAARWASLLLLKGRRLCDDYGRGRPQVRYFLDAAFSAEQVLAPEALERKLAALAHEERPLELVYFGRLAAYKGVDRCLEAVARAAARTAAPMRLHVIGAGEESGRLEALASAPALSGRVVFRGALPFGPLLFEALRPMQLLLAAPLSEDTPRSALDAMASGIPVLAFATEYYRDLASSGAVDVVPWPDVDRMADRIVHYAQDKRRLAPLARAGVEFARANTQEIWLGRRVQWTLDLFAPRAAS